MIKPYFRLAAIFLFLMLLGRPVYSVAGPNGYGLLYLETTPPQAEIALDGHFIDLHVWLISLPPGDHELMVRKPGFKVHYQQFAIEPGQNLQLNIHLQPEASGEHLGSPPRRYGHGRGLRL